MSLADQSPCTSWLAQYERTEACRAALALDVSGWPASRSAVAPRLTPSIKQIAQQSRVSLRTRDDMPRPVAFGLTRPPRGRGDGGLCTVTIHLVAISCAMAHACMWPQKATAAWRRKSFARATEKKTSSTVSNTTFASWYCTARRRNQRFFTEATTNECWSRWPQGPVLRHMCVCVYLIDI